MSENNNIKRFTATDIEKYQKGLLSAKEKHDLEKAALDDPFLADALEGYTIAGVYVAEDMKDLNERLADRIEEKRKVVAMPSERKRFALWKVAAILVLIAGTGFLVYQIGFNKKETSIAENNLKKNESASDTSRFLDSDVKQQIRSVEETKETTITNTTKTNAGTTEKKSNKISESFAVAPSKQVNTPVRLPLNNSKEIRNDNNATDQVTKKAEDESKISSTVAMNNRNKDADGIKDQFDKNQNAVVTNNAVPQVFAKRSAENQLHTNLFRGRVLDANNNPVPFANITNIADSVGTYADSKGVFNFVSTDTVMNVEVRSVGFNNINTQLRNRVLNNDVVLQEDRSISANVLLDTAKSNAIKRLHAKKDDDEEESEPEDSWGLYDTYLVNNLRVPDVVKTKKIRGQVEVSFEVDKNGEPTNFKITKSLCDACDKEAIRLIKEGPKWKRKARKGKTTITVSF